MLPNLLMKKMLQSAARTPAHRNHGKAGRSFSNTTTAKHNSKVSRMWLMNTDSDR